MQKYIRTCQECGKRHETKPPRPDDKAERWRDTKCKRCGSQALDFGSWREVDAALKDLPDET